MFFSHLHFQQPEYIDGLHKMNTTVVRFPGGVATNYYDYETGVYSMPDTDPSILRVILAVEVFEWAKLNGFTIVYGLNMNEPIARIGTLLQLIEDNNYPVVGIELGNENWHRDQNPPEIHLAENYFAKCLDIVALDSDIDLGITIAPTYRKFGNRVTKWNNYLMAQDLSQFKLILHHYVELVNDDIETATATVVPDLKTIMDDFETQFGKHKWWLTEVNIKDPRDSAHWNTEAHGVFLTNLFAALHNEGVEIGCIHTYHSNSSGILQANADFSERLMTWPGSSNPVEMIETDAYKAMGTVYGFINALKE